MLMGTSLITTINAAEGLLQYPSAPTTNQVDTFFGVHVQDPYRWMEDNNSPLLKKWINEENELTSTYLDKIPERNAIKERLTKLWNYERYGIPS